MEYICKECNKKYSSYQSLWIHNKKYHNNYSNSNKHLINHKSTSNQHEINNISDNKEEINKLCCKYCKKTFSFIQSRWRHEKNCIIKKNIENEEKLKSENQRLKNEIKLLKNNGGKVTKIINNRNIINTDNSQKIIINKTGTENIKELSYEEVSVIFDNEISSVIKLIEFINFSEDRPENHQTS